MILSVMESQIKFNRSGRFYTLQSAQLIRAEIDEVWKFFSRPQNLSTITPDYMNFKIINNVNEQAYTGQVIAYRLNLFPLIKASWLTEITAVMEHRFFIDEQRIGPYRIWHHEHYFESTDAGVMMHDKITFVLPFGVLHFIGFPLLVKPQLKKIFDYRRGKVDQLFNS